SAGAAKSAPGSARRAIMPRGASRLVEFIVTGESLMVHALHSQDAVRWRSDRSRIPRRRDHRNSPAAAAIASAPRGNGDDAAPTLHPPLPDEASLSELTADPSAPITGASS